MVDYVREMTVKKSCWYGEYGSLVFLFSFSCLSFFLFSFLFAYFSLSLFLVSSCLYAVYE